MSYNLGAFLQRDVGIEPNWKSCLKPSSYQIINLLLMQSVLKIFTILKRFDSYNY